MPVRVVLDHPRRYLGRRLWRPIATLVGALLLVVGIAASIVAVPATVLAFAWLVGENVTTELAPGRNLTSDEILLAWAIATPLAIFGIRRGLRFARGGRTLVLFLRRFGYDDVTSAVTFAVTRMIGTAWRLVALDDAEIAPVGVTPGAKWFFRAIHATSWAFVRLFNLLLVVFPAAQLGLWIVIGLDLVRARIWEHAGDERVWMAVLNPYIQIVSTVFDGRLPLAAVRPDLSGVFAVLIIVLAAIVLGLGAALSAAPIAWAVGAIFLFSFSFTADTVRQAEQLKTREIRTEEAIVPTTQAVVEWSHRVYGPRLVVLRVASAAWRQTVSRLAAASSVSLIDVSEPTENLIWEIEELIIRERARGKCVFICQHDRALELAGSSGRPSRPLDATVARLLEMEELLAYTTDRRGRRRFARALRSKLLSLSHS